MDNHNDKLALAGGYRKGNRVLGRKALSYTVIYTILLLSFIFLPGCSPKIVERVVYQRDTTVVHHRDSVLHRDSVYVKELMRGDTVYIEKYKDRLVYRDRWRDSIKIVRDSVAVETVKEVKVEKPLSWWQKVRICAFWWLLAGLVAALAWIFRKPLLGYVKGLF